MYNEENAKPVQKSNSSTPFWKTNSAFSKSLKITAIYFLFGSLWIVLTDLLADFLVYEGILETNIIKGLFYVIVTSVLIFYLIFTAMKKVVSIKDTLKDLNIKLEQSNNELQQERQKLLESEVKLKESDNLFRAVFDQATIGIAIGHNHNIVSSLFEKPNINAMFEQITGRSKEELMQMDWAEITHPDDLPIDLEYYRRFKAREINGYDMEKRYIRPDGSEAWIRMIISRLHMDSSDENHLCLVEDISERKEMEKILYDSERSKAVLLDNLPGMAYRCNYDPDWTMQFISEGCFGLTGYKPESLLNSRDKTFNDLISPEYREHLWIQWGEAIVQRKKLKEEYELITASGEVKWVFEQGQGVYDDSGNVIALEGLIIDITDRKQQELKLKYINDHDLLSGLLNRRSFQETVIQDLSDKGFEKGAVILLKLRKFNLMNLTMGYAYSENLVKEIANSLNTLVCDHVQLFHLSVDRFILYMRGYKEKEELALLCEKLLELMNNTYVSQTLGADMGVLEIDYQKDDIESILKNVSIAAKNAAENQIFSYSFFDDEMEKKLIREADIKNELVRSAYEGCDDCLYLMYQPIVDLRANRISGFEALARYKSDKVGFISPMEFIPIAEQTQLIIPLGRRIMRSAFNFFNSIEARGYDNITLSFNVSAIQLLRDDFIPDLIQLLEETGANPHKLGIELTESIFSNNYKVINERLKIIQGMGIKTAIDDFGTGYSSLARERELNINCLKIDKYFIDKLRYLDPKEAITGDIISMAHKLGHYVVAEGVEDEKQKQYLINHDCDYMQGYLFSKPLSEIDAFKLLETE